MKTVTRKDLLRFFYSHNKEQIREIAGDKEEWTALDVLALEEVPPGDRQWAVLREDFLSAPVLHKFMCQCAERALALVKNPDPRSVAGPEAKRAWLRGEIDDGQLAAAWDAARAPARVTARAAAWDAAWNTARAAAEAAAEATSQNAERAARAAARAAAWAAARDAAQGTVWKAARAAAWEAAWDAERAAQVELLVELLREAEDET